MNPPSPSFRDTLACLFICPSEATRTPSDKLHKLQSYATQILTSSSFDAKVNSSLR